MNNKKIWFYKNKKQTMNFFKRKRTMSFKLIYILYYFFLLFNIKFKILWTSNFFFVVKKIFLV